MPPKAKAIDMHVHLPTASWLDVAIQPYRVPAEKFFVLPKDGLHHENVLAGDEMLVEIQIPAPAAGTNVTDRSSDHVRSASRIVGRYGA